MILQASYDFMPRGDDSNKTLAFRKDDTLMFLEVFPKDGNWLQVVDRTGRIGFIPRNYVQISEDYGRDICLEFLLEAILKARREKLNTVERLESYKDHIVRVEYREFQTRALRKAMTFQIEESDNEPEQEQDARIEDGTTYYVTEDDGQTDPSREEKYSHQGNPKVLRNGSVTSFVTPSYRTHASIQTVPEISKTKISTKIDRKDDSKVINMNESDEAGEQPISGRASRSCPLGPYNIAPIDRNASGDNISLQDQESYNKTNSEYIPSHAPFQDSSSKTRIPIRSSKTNIENLVRLKGNASKELKSLSSRTKFTQKTYSIKSKNSPSTSSNDKNNLDRTTARLIKIVQESSGVDMKQSEVIVHRVLHHIHENFNPEMPSKIESILRLLQSSSFPKSSSFDSEAGSHKKFQSILKHLTSLGKQNLHEDQVRVEDESMVLDKMEQLQEEMLQFDSKTFQSIMDFDNYNSIHDLIILYQYEGRSSIKYKLLEIFSMIATLNSKGRSVLLRSTLPIELVREMYGNEGNPQKLSNLASPLISLMASGESMPTTHYDYLGSKFISFILNYLEEPSMEIDGDEKAKADLMNLILAYNLQFIPKDENVVIKTIAGRPAGRHFIESLLYLFKKEVDPIKSGEETGGMSGRNLDTIVQHSVCKLMRDMFSSKMTAEHFHTAEMKVLIDSMIRSLYDLGPGDNRRTEYLELIWLVLRNRAFQYRIPDIRECLVAILLEEDPLSIPDQRIVKGISKELPSLLKKGNVIIAGGRNRYDDRQNSMDSVASIPF